MTVGHVTSLLASLLGGLMIIFLRIRAAKKPVSLRKIVIPPLGMATGFSMFVVPDIRIPWLWALIAFSVGAAFFSVPLIRTSRMEFLDGEVYIKRSKAFVWIIFGMLALRILLHDWIGNYISVVQSAGVFFILAFGMILTWRLFMLRAYLQAVKTPAAVAHKGAGQ
ncbi:MAG: rane protein [Paenibacillaceae bacterium]|jgi:membrane protein CcdC involved in cytochrome C biogenesis|nr:rane protein [Paenibacillaceae bacterium]